MYHWQICYEKSRMQLRPRAVIVPKITESLKSVKFTSMPRRVKTSLNASRTEVETEMRSSKRIKTELIESVESPYFKTEDIKIKVEDEVKEMQSPKETTNHRIVSSPYFNRKVKTENLDSPSKVSAKEETVKEEISSQVSTNTVSPRKPRSPKKERVIRKEPENWKTLFDKIQEFRQNNVAVVDTMGCERLADSAEGDKVKIDMRGLESKSSFDNRSSGTKLWCRFSSPLRQRIRLPQKPFRTWKAILAVWRLIPFSLWKMILWTSILAKSDSIIAKSCTYCAPPYQNSYSLDQISKRNRQDFERAVWFRCTRYNRRARVFTRCWAKDGVPLYASCMGKVGPSSHIPVY